MSLYSVEDLFYHPPQAPFVKSTGHAEAQVKIFIRDSFLEKTCYSTCFKAKAALGV